MADEATMQDTAPGVDETSVDTTPDATPDTPDAVDGEATLGDAGKKALDAMKAKWREADRTAKENAAALAALQARVDGNEAEHQKSLEAQRVKDEALAAANQRILSAELRAAAAGKLNDPADALAYIDLSSFEVGDDGAVDADLIASTIHDLITRKPYLAAQGSRFQGSADGGARNDANLPAQLTQTDLARMSPEQIDEATNKGQFDTLLGRT